MNHTRIFTWISLLLAFNCAIAQQYRGGGGGFGGGVASGDNSALALNQTIDGYFQGREITSILTPGEANEWNLDLTTGQVILAQAKSDVFDPAIQIVDAAGKVLASNDDRFEGEQMPLLLWRCETAAKYKLLVRCFRDKAGGRFTLNMRQFGSVTLVQGQEVELSKAPGETLLHVRMQDGDFANILYKTGDQFMPNYFPVRLILSPNGLPALNIRQVTDDRFPYPIYAPMAGDYYVWTNSGVTRPIFKLDLAVANTVPWNGKQTSIRVPDEPSSLFKIDVKKGDIIEFSLDSRYALDSIHLIEKPNYPKYDPNDLATIPFAPRAQAAAKIFPLFNPPFDEQIRTVSVSEDCTAYLATKTVSGKNLTLTVRPAAERLEEGLEVKTKLPIGMTKFYEFDAIAGDVVTIHFESEGFAEQVELLDPKLQSVTNIRHGAGSSKRRWSHVIMEPGRYLTVVTSIGFGGGGTFSYKYTKASPKEFGVDRPAHGDTSDGIAQIWKFKLAADVPMILHMWREATTFFPLLKDAGGNGRPLNWVTTQDGHSYALIHVTEPEEFSLVILPGVAHAKYSITLEPVRR